MELTPNLRLPYPDDNDPGDGALDLQILAEAVDAAATLQLAALRAAINKPCRIAQLSVNTAGIAANVETSIFSAGFTWTILYDSSSIAISAAVNPFTQRGMGEEPGIYHLGSYLSTQPTGAITANSFRQLAIKATIPSDRTVFPATTTLIEGLSGGYETSSGSHQLNAELEVYTPFPSVGVATAAGTIFDATFFHQNTGSTVQINAGSLAWIWRAADVEAI
jgi:hypothetical protein